MGIAIRPRPVSWQRQVGSTGILISKLITIAIFCHRRSLLCLLSPAQAGEHEFQLRRGGTLTGALQEGCWFLWNPPQVRMGQVCPGSAFSHEGLLLHLLNLLHLKLLLFSCQQELSPETFPD